MKAKKTTIPHGGIIGNLDKYDYRDCFACIVTTTGLQATPDDILVHFWTSMPVWVKLLFRIRNFAARMIGLDTGQGGTDRVLEKCIRDGDQYRGISVTDKSGCETILCLDDKHLTAYLSVHFHQRNDGQTTISAVTVVYFKYWLGRAYFLVIKPFHSIIVKYLLAHAVNASTRYRSS